MQLQLQRLDAAGAARRGLLAGATSCWPSSRQRRAARGGGDPLAQRPGLGHARVPLGPALRAAGGARRVHARRAALALPAAAGGQPVPQHQRSRRAPGTRRRRARGARVPAQPPRQQRPPARGAHRLRRRRRAVLRRGRARVPARRPGRLPEPRTRARPATPLAPGPFKPLLQALHRLQRTPGAGHARAHRARHRAQRAGARTRDPHADGLADRGRRGDVPRRPAKGEFLREFEPDFFFDDQTRHVESAAGHVPAGHVAAGVSNEAAR